VAPEFSVREIPFSRFGAWFGLSPVVGLATYSDDVHLVSHRNGMHAVLSIVPVIDGVRVSASITAEPAKLTWNAGAGRITAAFGSPSTLHLAGTGLGVRISATEPALTPFTGTYLYPDPAGGTVFTSYETGHRFRVTVLSGQERRSGEQALGTAERLVAAGEDGDPWELVIEEITTSPPHPAGPGLAEAVTASAADFARFADAVAPWRGERTPAAELACYVIWSATVRPAGFITRPAVLMSKHWMDKVWSWDHCFTALALASGAPELAWDQFQVVFDHQDAQGALPDSITHSETLRNFVKPPIHGWALGRLRDRFDGEVPEAEKTYRQLSAWTRFWLDHRRPPGQALPYYEHGNDSGWDNATVFREERLVQSADLTAFLVLQLKELARLAAELGEPAQSWDEQADDLLAAMLDRLWDGTRFVSRGVVSGTLRAGSSLLELMPVVLGEHLPPEVFERLCDGIARHLTAVGPATELPTSPYYEADGYWRGPVWAPATVLIEDGLRRGGAVDLAERVSARFRTTCEKSGFAENFDALTGEGLRDRAYTWTAGAYLLLAEDAERRRGSVNEPRRTVVS
jgi:hypothetical protein